MQHGLLRDALPLVGVAQSLRQLVEHVQQHLDGRYETDAQAEVEHAAEVSCWGELRLVF